MANRFTVAQSAPSRPWRPCLVIGALHVLQYASPTAPSLHAQRVEYDDPPSRGRCFKCSPLGRPHRTFRTAKVETEPQRVDDAAVWFRTRDTVYLLARLPADDLVELEDSPR